METNNILCFGDSNTHGYDSVTGGRYSAALRWPRLLGKMLGSGFDVIEEGLSGRTTCFDDPLFEGLCGLTALYPCMMTHEPLDLLVVMLGTNDCKDRFCASPDNIAKGMSRLLQKAKGSTEAWRNGVSNILLVTPPPIHPDYAKSSVLGEMGIYCVEKSIAIEPLYRAVAESSGCHYLNAGEIPGIRMNLLPADCMHLSAESHTLLAEALAAKIRKIL